MVSNIIYNKLVNDLKFPIKSIEKLDKFRQNVLNYNKKNNLIAKSTENDIWHRHILDSAQLVKFISFDDNKSLSDLGSGAGFPGIVLSIFNNNRKFHVKIYEKSKVKTNFMRNVSKNLDIKCDFIESDIFKNKINSEYIVCRAFKKLDQLLRISRENAKKPHKLIILKGKSAQEEINISLKEQKFKYKLVNSITDADSKIVIVEN